MSYNYYSIGILEDGRYDVIGGIPGVCRTVMQRGPAQLSSVSDLYVSDEISVLLEEIHDLEPKGNIAPIDDEQEFEINGSQTGGSWLEVTNSMAGTPGSWDSHANYKHQEASRARYNGVVLHYDKRPMKTPSGVIRVLLLVSFDALNASLIVFTNCSLLCICFRLHVYCACCAFVLLALPD